jgi:hypothetical protein
MTPTVSITTDNPYASRWQKDSSCPEETPAGYRDQWFEYPMNFTVNANALAQNLFITLDRDADFVLRQIEPVAYQSGVPGTLVGAYRFRDGFGNALSEDFITNDVHGPIWPELVLLAGSRFFMDFDNSQQAFNAIVAVMLRGCKRYKVGVSAFIPGGGAAV